MAHLRLTVIAAAILFVCGCVIQQSEALDWKALPGVQAFLSSNPRARRMTQGPMDPLIDLLIQLLIKLIEIILGQPIREQMENLSERISLLERSTL